MDRRVARALGGKITETPLILSHSEVFHFNIYYAQESFQQDSMFPLHPPLQIIKMQNDILYCIAKFLVAIVTEELALCHSEILLH